MVTPDRHALAVEVGAGDGALTERLAARFDRLIAYEVDPHWSTKLKGRIDRLGNVRLVASDFLASQPPRERFHLVGNVPFGLTSQIIDWGLNAPTLASATVITQLEYARKRTGGFGRWSLLTILTWPQFCWELRGEISRTQFRPPPRVDAGVLHIGRRETALIQHKSLASYRRMVELGFTGVGGSLSASLRRAYPSHRVTQAFRDAGVAPSTVVAFVEPVQWLDLFASLSAKEDRGTT